MILKLILMTELDTCTAKTEFLLLSIRRLSLSDVIRNFIAKRYTISPCLRFAVPLPYMDRALPYKEGLRPPQFTIKSGINPLVRFAP